MSRNDKPNSDGVGAAMRNDSNQGTQFVGGYGRTVAEGLNLQDKPLEFRKTFSKLLKTFGPYRYLILAAVIFSAASTVFVVFGPKVMADITNRIFDGIAGLLETGVFDSRPIFESLVKLFLMYLASALFLYAQGFIMSAVSQKVSFEMRAKINEKLGRLPVGYFDGRSHGDVMSRITNDVDTVGNTLNQGLTQIVTAVCTIIGIAAMMFSMHVGLTFVVLTVLPLSYLVLAVVAKRSQRHFREQQNYLGSANGYIEEIYGGHYVVKAFGMEKSCVGKFSAVNERLYESGWKSQAASGLINPLIVFIGNLGYVSVIVLGAYLSIVNPSFNIGMMYAFVQYVRSFTSPINQTAQISNIIQSTVAAAERIFVFLETEEEKQPENLLKMPEAENIRGDIAFEKVTFGYDPERPVLKEFDLAVKAGSRVAVVGKTGSGKTTLVKLLMRFYDADKGRILLDGVDISRYDKDEYRKAVAMVLQDTWLFHGTIMENIRYGRPSATDGEVKEAAMAAGADRFIAKLEDGYGTVLGEETANLSEGEKQLLSIARAVIRKSRILIFDEATSSIDTLTERIVQDAVERVTNGKTSFVVAHRLSTIINSDLILVIEDGRLAEAGSHGELLKRNGLYAEMYATQFSRSVK